MDQTTKRRVTIALILVSFLSAGALIMRYYTATPKDDGLSQDELQIITAGDRPKGDTTGFPPQGDMTDQEYGRMLQRLREEAAGQGAEPGSALHRIDDP
jgi:hypothetical protein